MRDGWREVQLGDLFVPSNTRLGEHTHEPPVFSISKYDGVIPADQFFEKRIASAKLDGYKLLPADAWVYSTIHIDEGSIARNNTGISGVVSPMYTVMEWNSSFDEPRYLEHLLRSDEMLAVYSDSAQGSINRRRSLPWKVFSAIPIALPPLAEQRRIVDLIAAVDDAIDAAEAEAATAAQLLNAVLEAEECADLSTVAAIADVSSGASWGKAALRNSPHEASSVLTIANTKPDGTVSGDPTYVAGLSQSVARVTDSSIVAIRTNGNHKRIGNVYQVPSEYIGSAVSAFQLVIEPRDAVDSAHLYWMLRRPTFQENVTRAASGSTGLGNIAASKLRQMTVPWPDDASERARRVATYQRAADAADAARTHAESLRTLRSNLLTVLLSGEHEIPSSYDQLLPALDQGAAA